MDRVLKIIPLGLIPRILSDRRLQTEKTDNEGRYPHLALFLAKPGPVWLSLGAASIHDR